MDFKPNLIRLGFDLLHSGDNFFLAREARISVFSYSFIAVKNFHITTETLDFYIILKHFSFLILRK